MKPAELDKLFKQTLEEITDLNLLKRGEYAQDSDALSNFKELAKSFGVIPELTWGVYANKHMIAINTYIADLVAAKSRPSSESIEGRAKDLIVYSILFIALCKERNARKSKE